MSLKKLETELAATVQERHENIEDITIRRNNEYRVKIKGLRAEMQAVLTKGANACPECGRHPLGIHQPSFFEVRCLKPTCAKPLPGVRETGRHSKGVTAQNAIDNWNGEVYFKRGPALVVTKAEES